MELTTSRTRAQSEVLGFVLLVGMVVLAVTTILVVGNGAMTELSDASAAENAELVMAQFDSQVSGVSLGSSERRAFDFAGDGAATVDEGAGTITIRQIGCESCPRAIEQTTLGAVEYAAGGTTVAYQGGGVWRKDGDRVSMSSPPEFHYAWGDDPSSNPTLTFPVVSVRGSETISGTAEIRQGSSRPLFPDSAAGLENPLSAGSIEVDIQSEYYEGWAAFFEQRTSVESVDTDDRTMTTTVVLSIPGKSRTVTDGVATVDPTLNVRGSSLVDSYNSSKGTYAATKGAEGSVYVGNGLRNAGEGTVKGSMRVSGDYVAGGGIDVTGRLVVNGDVEFGGGSTLDNELVADGDFVFRGDRIDAPVTVAGDVVTTGGVDVHGDITAGGDFESGGSSMHGDVHVGGNYVRSYGEDQTGTLTLGGEFVAPDWYEPAGPVYEGRPAPDLSAVGEASDLVPPEMTAIDPTIDARIDAYRAANDNAGSDASRVEAGDCGSGSPSCTLTAGTYYFDDLDLRNDDVTFDTSDGPVYVAVAGDVTTRGASVVRATGPNEVHVYAGGDVSISTEWDSAGSRGDQIWLYGASTSTVAVSGGNADFHGVVYAPGNRDISVGGSGQVYGALVGSVSSIHGNAAVHYDTVLGDQKPELVGGGGAPLTYLHISHNEVHVEDAG